MEFFVYFFIFSPKLLLVSGKMCSFAAANEENEDELAGQPLSEAKCNNLGVRPLNISLQRLVRMRSFILLHKKSFTYEKKNSVSGLQMYAQWGGDSS